jgi:hypothetical protein
LERQSDRDIPKIESNVTGRWGIDRRISMNSIAKFVSGGFKVVWPFLM